MHWVSFVEFKSGGHLGGALRGTRRVIEMEYQVVDVQGCRDYAKGAKKNRKVDTNPPIAVREHRHLFGRI